MIQQAKLLIAAMLVLLLTAGLPSRAADVPAATESATGDLRIVVTAVQGQAQVKFTTDSNWQPASPGLVLPVGCQIRTGIPGSMQFTVGEDEVYRVDRLSLVQVVKADQGQGKIKTVMGMTYGRVSKDVDAPVLPHEDAIVSPSGTLATRGTRVSLYDQPPYAPEAVSLTGTAVFHNPHGQSVQLGTKGGGTAKVVGNDAGPGQHQLRLDVLDPQGDFSGRTDAEEETLLAFGGITPDEAPTLVRGNGLLSGSLMSTAGNGGISGGGGSGSGGNGSGGTGGNGSSGGNGGSSGNGGGGSGGNGGGSGGNGGNGGNGGGSGGGSGGSSTLTGELEFPLLWTGSPNAVVDFSVQSPLKNESAVSFTNRTVPSGGLYNITAPNSNTANSKGVGQQEIDWGNLIGGTFPIGTYTLTETLEIPMGLLVTPHVSTELSASQQATSSSSPINATTAATMLTSKSPTATYTVTVPITAKEMITLKP